MKPIRTTEWAIHFASALSPWWLLLLLPLTALAGWLLYRRQQREVRRRAAIGLLALRLALLILVMLLLFRPSLVAREILTWPSRLLVVLDDSRSMQAPDPDLPLGEALHIARRLDPDLRPRNLYAQGKALEDATRELYRFERLSRDADRQDDAFWDAADASRQALRAAIPENTTPELREAIDLLYAGERHPGHAAFEALAERLRTLATERHHAQTKADTQAIADGNEVLRQAATRIRAMPRLQLATELLRQAPADLPGHFIRRVDLLAQHHRPLHEGLADLAAQPGTTDLTSALHDLVTEESPFPLAGIVLLSDGRDLGGQPIELLAQQSARRQITISTAAIGAEAEPFDLAILDTRAAPIAVAGQPLTIDIHLKTALPRPAETQLRILHRDRLVASRDLTLGQAPETTVTLTFTPEETGYQRYQIHLQPVDAEVFPSANNHTDLVLNVRQEKLRVLFLDWLPRWQTRFALNIFQRLDYIDLNAIIGVVQPDGELPRGIAKGTWPMDEATLQLYDLVIIGDLPENLLTQAEQQALDRLVTDHGRTRFHLAASDTPLPADALRLTSTGRYHPLTRALHQHLPLSAEAPPHTLLTTPGTPLLTAAWDGHGKQATLATDDLWRWLNPTALAAHTSLWVNLPTWSIDATRDPDTGLAIDQRTLPQSHPLQLHATGTTVEALRNGEIIASADVQNGRAIFHDLPPGELTIRPAGATTTIGPIHILPEDPELKHLARDTTYLTRLSHSTDGIAADALRLTELMQRIEPRENIERHERTWRLWDSTWMLALLILLLTAEWIWRKLEGLV